MNYVSRCKWHNPISYFSQFSIYVFVCSIYVWNDRTLIWLEGKKWLNLGKKKGGKSIFSVYLQCKGMSQFFNPLDLIFCLSSCLWGWGNSEFIIQIRVKLHFSLFQKPFNLIQIQLNLNLRFSRKVPKPSKIFEK